LSKNPSDEYLSLGPKSIILFGFKLIFSRNVGDIAKNFKHCRRQCLKFFYAVADSTYNILAMVVTGVKKYKMVIFKPKPSKNVCHSS
jgi:hypothetical protein